jgi:hypothetical protein
MLSKNDNDRAHTHTGQTEQERPNGGRKEKKGGEREAGVGRVAENEYVLHVFVYICVHT